MSHNLLQDIHKLVTRYSDNQTLLDNIVSTVSLAFGKAYFAYPNKKLIPLSPNAFSRDVIHNTDIGTFVVIPQDTYSFSDNDIETLLWIVNLITILFAQINNSEKELIIQAKSTIGMLTYSELTAALSIFKELENNSLIILGHFADKHGFSRSVVGNTVRKIQSAKCIEARSLGVKGTNIKIINEKLVEELGKLRV